MFLNCNFKHYTMNCLSLPDDCTKQWEILLLLICSEEKKIDRTGDNEIDTMNYFYKNEGIRRILLQWLEQMKTSHAKRLSATDTALKCDEISLYWRQIGNEKFKANHIEESYRYYTRSVIYAKQDAPMYARALANRSAALLRMRRFKECLSDIDLAITYGYPVGQRHKLFLRRADCHIELIQRTLALASKEEALQHAAALKLPKLHLEDFHRQVNILNKKIDAVLEDAVLPHNEVLLPECFLGSNEDFNAASNAIEIRSNDSVGRYVVARRAMKRGDILFSEEPYASVILPYDPKVPVCDACGRTEINPVPCTLCSRTLFCSMECRSHAWETYHHWECVGVQCELFSTIGIAHLALRVFLVTTSAGFPATPNECKPYSAAELFDCYSNVDKVEIYKQGSIPFFRMFNLVTNFDKMNNSDYIQYALTATMLTIYLKNFTSFFEYLPSKIPYKMNGDQLRLFASAVILRNLGQLVCNGHATLSLATFDEKSFGKGRTVTEREVRKATAIYPSAAMMNHSCDPNIINTFYNNRLIIKCLKEINVGEEVFNCYGPHKARETAIHRRYQLRAQYMFICSCDACIDIEKRGDFVTLFSAYACQSCKSPVPSCGKRYRCPHCKADLPMDRVIEALDKADDFMTKADRAHTLMERLDKINTALRLRQRVLNKHHTSIRSCVDSLARTYADIGDFGKSIELIKQNVQSLEYQFGSFSVEVAHELRKLSDVMFERIISIPVHDDYGLWCLESHKIVKKSIQLIELNYGSWEPLVKRLQEQERVVAALLADAPPPQNSAPVRRMPNRPVKN